MKNPRFIIFFILFIILLFSISCKQKSEIYRFIDHLDTENIVSSPLIDPENNFNPVEQKFSASEMNPWIGDTEGYRYFPLDVSLLGWDDSLAPAGMKVFQNGRELEFRNRSLTTKNTWKWKRIQETIEPGIFQGYKKFNGSIVLQKDEYFTTHEIYFPEAEYTFEIEARSHRPRKYLPRLQLYLDDKMLDEFAVKIGRNLYRFHGKIPSGKYRLKVGFSNIHGLLPYEEEENIILGRIHIKSDQDFILVSRPEEKVRKNDGESYRIVLKAQPNPKLILNDLILKDRESLERTIAFPSDFQVLEILCHAEEEECFLSLWLDDREIDAIRIAPWIRKPYAFYISESNGSKKMRLVCQKSGEAGISDARINIHRMSYYSPKKKALLALHRFKDISSIQNLDIKENPFLIKKKLRVKDYTLNTLFSPPYSEFRFKIKIPESGFLEFGMGFLKELSEWDEENQEIVEFSISIQNKKEKIPLFTKNISPSFGELPLEMQSHKIDLSPYAGKTVFLCFLTTSSTAPEPSKVYSYWYNPVLVPNQNDKSKKKETQPNIMLISLDTLRADHLHCYGYERKTSPFIDKLAENSVVFANCYSPTGKTLPSHMSMFTSLYPIHHRLLANGNYVVQRLDESIPTITEVLRNHSYFTGAFTGGAYVDAQYGFSKGFDFYYDDPSTYNQISVDHLFQQTKQWLAENQNKKFFLFLHTYQIHGPYSSPEPYNLIYQNKNAKWKSADLVEIFDPDPYKVLSDDERHNLVALYDGEITYTDENLIKPLIDLLRELGLYDRTLIVLTSDHGEEFSEHKGWRHGLSLYNEQLKVPLIMKFPDSKYGGKRIAGNASLVDLMPTILEYAGIKFSGYEPDGISLLDEIRGKKTEKRFILGSRYIYTLKERQSFAPFLISYCAIENSSKLILNNPYPEKHPLFFSPSPPSFPVDEIEMFNLDNDPRELTNTTHDNPLKTQEMMSRILFHYRYALELEEEFWEGKAIDSRLQERLKALGYIR